MSALRISVVLMLATIDSTHAQDLARESPNIRAAIVEPVVNVAFPQIAVGDGWKTTFYLVNLDSKPSRYRLTFGTQNGSDLTLNIIGVGTFSSVQGIIPINGSVKIDTDDSGPLRQGYAVLSTAGASGFDGQVSGVAIFRQRVAGRPDFEAAVPASAITEKRIRLPFDNTNGAATAIALLNFELANSRISVEFWDENGGRLAGGSIDLPIVGQTAFTLAGRFPEVANRRGVAEFITSGRFMGSLGLRFLPTGAFTSVPPLALTDWTR